MKVAGKLWNLAFTRLKPFSEIGENRPVLLVTSSPAWNAVKNELRLPVVVQVEPIEATTAHWEELQSSIANRQFEIIYAVAADWLQALKSLPGYARKYNLPYGISHEMEKAA